MNHFCEDLARMIMYHCDLETLVKLNLSPKLDKYELHITSKTYTKDIINLHKYFNTGFRVPIIYNLSEGKEFHGMRGFYDIRPFNIKCDCMIERASTPDHYILRKLITVANQNEANQVIADIHSGNINNRFKINDDYIKMYDEAFDSDDDDGPKESRLELDFGNPY